MSKVRIKNLIYNNEKGYTLAIVLMVMLIFSVLGMSVMAMSMNSVKMSGGEREDQAVFYIAEAALNTEMALIEQKVNQIFVNTKVEATFYNNVLAGIGKESQTSLAKFEESSGHIPRAELTVLELNKNNPRDYKIRSVGYINSKKRVVEQDFSIEFKSTSNNKTIETAVLTKENIILNGSINGDIATIKNAKESITVGEDGKNFKNKIFVPAGFEGTAVKKTGNFSFSSAEIKKMESTTIPALPIFPQFPINLSTNWESSLSEISGKRTLSLTNDYYISSFDLNTLLPWGGVLIINLNGSDRKLVIDNFKDSDDRKVVITGGGKLKLYINDTIQITGSGVMNGQLETGNALNEENITANHLKKLEIYFKGGSFNATGTGKIYGSIYLRNGDVNVSGSGAFYGNIVSGGNNITISGGGKVSHSLIFAPQAHIKVNSGRLTGASISKSFEIQQYGVIYKAPIITEGPFVPEVINSAEVKVMKKVLNEK